MSLRARKGVAIFWNNVQIRSAYQEIATGFALAMTAILHTAKTILSCTDFPCVGGGHDPTLPYFIILL